MLLTDMPLDERLGLATRIMKPMLTDLAVRAARRWIAKTLGRSRKRCPLGATGLKGLFEGEEPDQHHLPLAQFGQLLDEAGLLNKAGVVRAKFL